MRLLLAVLALLFATPVMAAEVNTGHLKAELIAQDATVAPGTTAYVALRQDIDTGWHTYWRNPGDSGEPPKLTWTLPAGWKTGEFVWATPRTLPFGPLTNYGYSGEVVLPVPIEVPANAKPGPVILEAVIDVLVCEKICIPETGKLSVTLTVADGAPKPDARWGATVAGALAAAPKPAGLAAAFQTAPALTLTVAGGPLKGADMSGAWFFPFEPTVIDHAKAQTGVRGSDGLTLTLPPGYAFEAGKPPPAMAGVLVVGGKAYEINATPGPAPAGVSGGGAIAAPETEGAAPAAKTASGSLLLAAFAAFLGGLILNLMPCVFPVLSMKAASLAGHAHDARATRLQGLAYGAGVVATFLILAGVLIGLQLAGQQVGWGFQLQSPPVVGALALLMLAVALNMSGVFEAGTSLQGAGSGLAAKGGTLGAFFTGVLAVVVASPCTAPFMASALGFTLGQPPAVVLAVFLALSLGFALPFVALAFAPALLRLLPRPGAWMDTLRKVLAFPMYGAAAWLVWVLSQQTDAPGLALALIGLLTGAFALWLWGLGPRLWRQILAGLLMAAAIALVLQPATAVRAQGQAASAAELPSEAWSADRVAALRAEGKVVFVNFTAAWCVSCQVNDKVALQTVEVADALKAANGVYLKADWTNRNPEIAAALAEHGRAGVPLYLVYGPGAEKPQILPQLLTPGMVAEALGKAANQGR